MTAAVAGLRAYSQVKTQSSAVNGLPSCQVTPFFSFQVTDLPSAARVPSSRPGNRLRQDGPQVAVGIPAGQRLVEQARAVLVLGADGEMRIEQGRALPPQHLQQAAAAALGRLVGRPRLGHGHARKGEQLRRHRRRQSHGHHATHKGATGQRRPPSPGPTDHASHVRSLDASIQIVEAVLTLSLSCKMRASPCRKGNRPAATRQ